MENTINTKTVIDKKNKAFQDEDIDKNHDVAAFAWTLLFAPVLLILRRDSKFIQFHSKQAIILLIFGVLIFALPKPFSNLNILTLAVAVAGFLNANLGRYWKVPFLYDMVEKGISPGSIAMWIKNVVFGFFSIIKRIFTGGPGFAIRGTFSAVAKARGIDAIKVNKRVDALELEKEIISAKANFLERELLIEKFLQGEHIKNLDKETQAKIGSISDIFNKNRKIIVDADAEFTSIKNKDKEVLFGNLDKTGGFLFVNFEHKEKTDIIFGDWSGIGVMFENLEESIPTLNKLADIFTKK